MSNKPHILLITSDQHRGDWLGCTGHPCVRTPHLDQLAASGVRFNQAWTDCPVCIPARTTLITGRQSHHYGCPRYAEDWRITRERADFLGSLLTAAGYQTELVGKTHWHTPPRFRAGFEHVTWFSEWRSEVLRTTGRSPHANGLGFNELSAGPGSVPPRLQGTVWAVDRALDVIDSREPEQPLFLWLSLQDPHPPICIHEPYYSMYDGDALPEPAHAEWAGDADCPRDMFLQRHHSKVTDMTAAALRKSRGVYSGMVTHMDHQVGRVFAKLQRDGMWDDTLVIYTSDHGEFLGDFGLAHKVQFTGNCARVPFIVRPPGTEHTPGSIPEALIEWADILPTLCDYAGCDGPEDVDGVSIRPVIEGTAGNVRGFFHGQIDDRHCYHDGRYKYLYFASDGSELAFDTVEDPQDLHPLGEDHVARLREALIEHLRDEGSPGLVDGELVNRRLSKPSVQEARAGSNAGLSAVACMDNLLSNLDHMH